MSRLVFRTVFVTTCLALGVVACRAVGSHTEYGVYDGKNYCQVITLPTPWSAKSPSKEWLGVGMQYRWPKDNHEEILVTPKPQEETDYSSDKVLTGRMLVTPKYRISLSIPVRLTPVTDQEWNSGTEARRWPGEHETTYEILQGGIGPDVRHGERDPREFRYEGHLFDRSGKIWGPYNPVLLSPNKRYVALQSWDGWWLSGKAPYSGELYIDIYAASSGQPIARIRGKWSDWTPDGAQKDVYWLTDHDLISPFDWDQRSFLVCHLP